MRPAYGLTVDLLKEKGMLDSFRFLEGKLLLALDGTGYFFSESIHCPSCTVHHHRDGRTTYSHSVLLPVLVHPERSQVIPLEPEFITPQDGHEKQDCEYQAAKRWLETMGSRYASFGAVLLGPSRFERPKCSTLAPAVFAARRIRRSAAPARPKKEEPQVLRSSACVFTVASDSPGFRPPIARMGPLADLIRGRRSNLA